MVLYAMCHAAWPDVKRAALSPNHLHFFLALFLLQLTYSFCISLSVHCLSLSLTLCCWKDFVKLSPRCPRVCEMMEASNIAESPHTLTHTRWGACGLEQQQLSYTESVNDPAADTVVTVQREKITWGWSPSLYTVNLNYGWPLIEIQKYRSLSKYLHNAAVAVIMSGLTLHS